MEMYDETKIHLKEEEHRWYILKRLILCREIAMKFSMCCLWAVNTPDPWDSRPDSAGGIYMPPNILNRVNNQPDQTFSQAPPLTIRAQCLPPSPPWPWASATCPAAPSASTGPATASSRRMLGKKSDIKHIHYLFLANLWYFNIGFSSDSCIA